MLGRNAVRGHYRRMKLEAQGPVERSNADLYAREGKESPWKARQGLSSRAPSGEGGFIVVDHWNDNHK